MSRRTSSIGALVVAVALVAVGCAKGAPAASLAPARARASGEMVARDPRLTPPPLAKELAPLAWMEGRWVAADGHAEETWTASGRVLVGVGFETRGASTSGWEALAIDLDDGAPAYVAMPDGRPPTRFASKELAGTRALFANPTHDFPKTLEYQREGDHLAARVAGDAAGKAIAYAWSARPRERAPELDAADRSFEEDVARRGADAWRDAFDPAGAMLGPDGRVEGREAVRALIAPMFASGTKLRWGSIASGWSPARDIGFTVGRYVRHRDASDAGPAKDGRGTYVTIWRRGSDGVPRVLFDTGFPEKP